MLSVFLSSYRNTHRSLEELKEAGNTRLSVLLPTAFLVLPNFYSCSITRYKHGTRFSQLKSRKSNSTAHNFTRLVQHVYLELV